ncbi:MAG: phosphoribosylglycinamide synthetase C domain-containing protein, partial [Rickettsiella sp.]|nr:phosphoribosylglycinamide synthetase C domain-containing protein [Rickettsiella sp.]
VCQAITSGKLHTLYLTFTQQASVCRYLVPQGYPDQPYLNDLLNLQQVHNPDALFYASVIKEQNHYRMQGSRAIAVLGLGDTLSQANEKVDTIIADIKGTFYHRPDIGKEKNNV